MGGKSRIRGYSEGAVRIPKRDPDISELFELADACNNRFDLSEELDDLKKAIVYGTRAVHLTPKDDCRLRSLLDYLSLLHCKRFRHLDEVEDLGKAIKYQTRAVSLTPYADENYPFRLANLGSTYYDRYERQSKLGDLAKAIEYGTRAVNSTPDIDPDLPLRLFRLGTAYTDRFKHLGELDALDKAIEYRSRLLALTPDGHAEMPNYLVNLGSSCCDRFLRLGELDDLTKAIEHQSRAISLTPDNHPELSVRLGHLGASYTYRFGRLGELDDIEKAIKLQSRALALVPDGHSRMPTVLNNLGSAYRDRFDYLGELGDLEKSIEYATGAIDSSPDEDPGLPILLANLATRYGIRFTVLDELEDIEKAIVLASRALDLTSNNNVESSLRLSNLGVFYCSRFRRSDTLSDLEKAIELGSRALALTPDGDPQLPDRYFNQAQALFHQYRHTDDPAHAKDALGYFRKAAQLSTGAPRDIFWNALQWSKLASENSLLNCMEAYQVTMDLLPQFICLGATTHQRYHDLSTSESLALKAAYAAVRHGNHVLALEWLEHARCVVWNQTLALRSPLDRLHSSYPDLSARLQAISQQLQDAGSNLPESQALSSSSVTPEEVGEQRRRLAKEYSSLLAEARALPGFEDFLQPMKARDLIRAARYGPIIVINCHDDRCDALIILPGQDDIQCLSLPDFNQEKARKARTVLETSLRRKGLRQRGLRFTPRTEYQDRIPTMLRELWKCVVKPIIDFLGLTNDIPLGSLPHITWCPTGALSFLPLHAAGDYRQPRSRVFDYAISSYTPTLAPLLASTSNSVTHTPRVLAIGQANAPGLSSLPGTARELASLQTRAHDKAEYSQLIDDAATTTAVLDAMEQHDWVHLACHAHQNVTDPTQSGFHLHDGTLDLAAINRRSFKNKGLAFLSACQTATGDEKLPDEAVHLASGMLMAGYPSVIATMWSVVDDDAPFVADKVYAQLLTDGKVGNGEAGKALHYAVAELRERVGEKEFGRWVPYIHIGS